MLKLWALILLLTPIALLPTSKPSVLQTLRGQGLIPLRSVSQQMIHLPAPNPTQTITSSAPFSVPSVQPMTHVRARDESDAEHADPKRTRVAPIGMVDEENDDDEKSEQSSGSDLLYTSAEDVNMLMELCKKIWEIPAVDYVQVLKARELTRFLEALDARNMHAIAAMARKNINLLFSSDERKKYQALVKTDAAQICLDYIHEIIASPESLPANYQERLGRYGNEALSGLAAHLNGDARINPAALVAALTKDWSFPGPVEMRRFPSDISLDDAHASFGEWIESFEDWSMDHLFINNVFSQAIIKGDIEMVEVMVDAILATCEGTNHNFKKLFLHELTQALRLILDYSSIAESSDEECKAAAAELCKDQDISGPLYNENYPKVARRLIQAYMSLAISAEQTWFQNHVNVEQQGIKWLDESPLAERSEFMLRHAMRNGSQEMFQTIAEEMRHIKRDPRNGLYQERDQRLYDQVARIVRNSDSGEKLGILLALDAHPESTAYIFAMGMLSRVEKNPEMLERLQTFVRRNRIIQDRVCAEVGGPLLPELASIVSEYISPRMPAHIVNYILHLKSAADSDTDSEAELD